jgi:hypothetical protein
LSCDANAEAKAERDYKNRIKGAADTDLHDLTYLAVTARDWNGAAVWAVNKTAEGKFKESLESFWQGWRKSPNSALAFCQFFDRNDRFRAFRGHSQKFYVNIRCGIMHQGETTGGWHIRRDRRFLFEPATTTIDATRFLEEMDCCLSEYCDLLRVSEWNSDVWKNLRKKMNAVCANSKREA